MMKQFLTKVFFIIVCLLCTGQITKAQDSVKKVAPKPVAKPLPAKAVTTVPYHNQAVIKPPVANPQTGAGVPAQTMPPVETPVSTDKSLAGQYQYVLSKTYHYQQPMIAALWKNINDTLNLARKNLKDAQAKLTAQGKAITDLQNDAKAKEQTLNEANSRRDEIGLLGMYMPKSTYNLLMWGLVLGFGLALVIVILRTAGHSREARYRTTLYEELNEEFTAYKAKANDKEKKLARELQTERNKVDELMGRG